MPNENAKLTALHLRADGVDYTVDINGARGSVTLPYSPDRPALTIASIAISEGATAALADNADATADANVSLDENNKFTITVTAGNATSAYTITIATAPNDEAGLLSLKLNDGATDYTVDISADKTGAVHVPHNTDLASLTIGAIEISDNATSSLQEGETITLNGNQFSITVTAEDGETQNIYTITVIIAMAPRLLSLSIAGKAVEFAGTTGSVTLLYGTDLADVTIDSISLSDDATADFSNGAEAKAGATIPALNGKQFTITVTAEDGTTTADYTITIDDTPTLAVTGHYAEQRIGAGDFTKDNLLQIGNVQNGEWSYAISVTGTATDGMALTLPSQTQTATASDTSFDANPLTADQWNMFRDTSPDNLLLTIDITLWRSGEDKPAWSIVSLGSIAKEQYLLKSWQDVQAINHDLAGDYTLMHDITFPEPGTDGMPTEGFEPIGKYRSNTDHDAFTGSLNGNGHTLHNLFINRGNTPRVGLVAELGTDASIDSLSLVLHADGIRGGNNTGALVGDNFGSISHSDVSGDVSGGSSVGGLVGHNEASSISQSYATGYITGISHVGGLIGRNIRSSISHSHASGNVNADKIAGGLIGASDEPSSISNSYASGNVVSTTRQAGGLVGESSRLTITNSYTSGDVNGDIAGGLVGDASIGSIENSYASGRVTSNSDSSNVGGLVGRHNSGTTTNSYWDKTVNSDITGGSGTGKPTTEIQMQATFDADGDNASDWDFDAIWCINEGNDYPRLRGVGGQDLTNCE